MKQAAILIIILCLFLFSNTRIFAQTDFKAAYALSKSGDSLVGYFSLSFEPQNKRGANNRAADNVDNNAQTTGVYYKKVMNGKVSKLDLDNLNELHFDDGSYYEVFSDASHFTDLYRCWIKGSVSMYSRTDIQMIDHIYLVFNEQGLQELLEVRTEVKQTEGSTNRYNKTNKLYYRVLSAAYLDCPSILPTLDQYELNILDIKKSLRKYYDCKGEAYQTFELKKNPVSRPEVGIYGGINYYPLYKNSTAKTNIGYNMGALVNLFLFSSRKTFSIQGEINMIHFKQEDIDAVGNQFIGQSTSITNIAKKHWRTRNTTIFLGVGYNLGIYTGLTQSVGPVQIFFDYRFQKLNKGGASFVNIGLILNSDAF